MFRKDILCVFFEHLKIDPCGRYFIELNDEIYYIEVEDTAFVVTAVCKRKASDHGPDQIEILVSDESLEELDLKSLVVGDDNILYCRIKKGRFLARFARKSYYQLAEFIEMDDAGDRYYIALNNQKYFITSN